MDCEGNNKSCDQSGSGGAEVTSLQIKKSLRRKVSCFRHELFPCNENSKRSQIHTRNVTKSILWTCEICICVCLSWYLLFVQNPIGWDLIFRDAVSNILVWLTKLQTKHKYYNDHRKPNFSSCTLCAVQARQEKEKINSRKWLLFERLHL